MGFAEIVLAYFSRFDTASAISAHGNKRFDALIATGFDIVRRCETIEVDQPVTRLPPHRSRRAELPHRALQNCSRCTRHLYDDS